MTSVSGEKAYRLRNALWFNIPVSVGCGIFYAGILSAGIALLDPWLPLGLGFGSARLRILFLILTVPCSVAMYWTIRKSRMTPKI